MDIFGFVFKVITTGIGLMIGLASLILIILAWWRLFEKAGEQGFKAIIPIYNFYTLCKIVYGNGWYMLLAIIPFVNVIFGMYTMYSLAKVFGQPPIICILNMFFAPIITLYIAFGPAQYEGPTGQLI